MIFDLKMHLLVTGIAELFVAEGALDGSGFVKAGLAFEEAHKLNGIEIIH